MTTNEFLSRLDKLMSTMDQGEKYISKTNLGLVEQVNYALHCAVFKN